MKLKPLSDKLIVKRDTSDDIDDRNGRKPPKIGELGHSFGASEADLNYALMKTEYRAVRIGYRMGSLNGSDGFTEEQRGPWGKKALLSSLVRDHPEMFDKEGRPVPATNPGLFEKATITVPLQSGVREGDVFEQGAFRVGTGFAYQATPLGKRDNGPEIPPCDCTPGKIHLEKCVACVFLMARDGEAVQDSNGNFLNVERAQARERNPGDPGFRHPSLEQMQRRDALAATATVPAPCFDPKPLPAADELPPLKPGDEVVSGSQVMTVEAVLDDGRLRCRWTKPSGLVERRVYDPLDVLRVLEH